MRGIFTLRKSLSLFLTALIFLCHLTVSAQCPTGNCGGVDQNFSTSNGGFTSTDFTYSTAPGNWRRTGLAPNTSYSITSGVIATGNASIANIGFSLFQSARDDIDSYTINIRDANTNAIIAQCTNPSPFDTTATTCVAIASPALPNRNIRIEFVLLSDAGGSAADQLLFFDNARWEFTQSTGIPSDNACPGGVTEDFDNGNTGDFIGTNGFVYSPGTGGDGFFTIPLAPDDTYNDMTFTLTSGRYQVGANAITVVTGFSYDGDLAEDMESLVVNIRDDANTILASVTIDDDADDFILNQENFCVTIRDLDLAGKAVRVEFVFNTDGITGGSFEFDDFRINLPQAITPPPLPVEFISFNAKKADNGVQLLWTVGTEINVDRYEIERSSDGVNFAKIGSTPAISSSSYSFTDSKPLAGVAYYRVRNVDHDGQYAYTPVLKYNNGQVSGLTKVFPTLTKGLVTFQHPSVTGKATITILTQEGKTLRTLTLSRGTIATPVDLSTYPSGTYLLRFVAENSATETFRIFKQ